MLKYQTPKYKNTYYLVGYVLCFFASICGVIFHRGSCLLPLLFAGLIVLALHYRRKL